MKVGRSDLDQEHRREQIEEYNILDFSNWQDGVYFDRMERRLVEGIDLFHKEKDVFGLLVLLTLLLSVYSRLYAKHLAEGNLGSSGIYSAHLNNNVAQFSTLDSH
jgi:hypothetical protein